MGNPKPLRQGTSVRGAGTGVTGFGFQPHLFLAVYLWFSHLISVSQFPYLINRGNDSIYLFYSNTYI